MKDNKIEKKIDKKKDIKNDKKNSKKSGEGHRKLKGFVASFFTIIGFIIALIAWKDDEYVMYYANHGLVLFIGELIIGALNSLSFLGWYSSILWVLWVILWVLTWINALSGEKKRTFIITDLAEKIKI